MKFKCVLCIVVACISCSCMSRLYAQIPETMGFEINGKFPNSNEALAIGKWHTITAKYRYSGDAGNIRNIIFAICERREQIKYGFLAGYHFPGNRLSILKHGSYFEAKSVGHLGKKGIIIENDLGYIDCENSTIKLKANDIFLSCRIKFKTNAIQGVQHVLLYIEDKSGNHDGFNDFGTIIIDKDPAVYRTDMPKQWKNSLKPMGNTSANLSFAKNGKANYTLVVPRNPKGIESKAAYDIARYFNLISGADFAIVDENEAGAGTTPFISIGRTRLLEQSRSIWKYSDLGTEGYALEVIGKDVYLYGGNGRGLLHGVYSLLEEDLGCRWYSPCSIDVPKNEQFSTSLASRKYVPALELRDPYISKILDCTWALRNKTNSRGVDIPSVWGGSIRFYRTGHTYAAYFPTEKYFDNHPEYYAFINGKRRPSQLCHTNEDVIRLSIEKTCKIFRDNPDVTITAIGPNDGRRFCDCPKCKKLDDENGGRSGSFFYFVNRIAEGVKKEFPNNNLISLAYLDYAKPPTKIKVDPYIIIQLCTDSHAWKYQFCFLWESEDYQRMLKAWDAAGAKIFIWDYTTDFVHYLVPMANWPVVADNIRFNMQHGAKGIMLQCNSSDNDEMRGWVWAKQLWNPELDTKPLMKDFIFGYYKESAQPIWDYEMMKWDYWERWHKVPHKCGEPSNNPLLNNMQCSYSPDGPMFTTDFMAKMREYFTQAEELAKSPEILGRVQKAKMSLLYLELSQNLGYYTEFGDFKYGKSIRKSQAEKQVFKKHLGEFIDLCKKNKQFLREHHTYTVEKITAKWQSCIDMDGKTMARLDLPAEWIFATDAENKGVSEKWYLNNNYYDAAVRKTNEYGGGDTSVASLGPGLHWLHINRGIGWEQQGFPGYDGYGWYFQNLNINEQLFAKKYLYLYFRGINEQAWIYVNGELVYEHTYASTGKSPGSLAGVPFSCDIKKYISTKNRNTIAVRVSHSTGLGGICYPAMIIGTDEPCSITQLDKYRY